MKVYYEACLPEEAELITDYLHGRFPSEEGSKLFTADSPPGARDIWVSTEYPRLNVERVYEIDLLHSEEELAPYRCNSNADHREWWHPVRTT
jgi:hypothetical protein